MVPLQFYVTVTLFQVQLCLIFWHVVFMDRSYLYEHLQRIWIIEMDIVFWIQTAESLTPPRPLSPTLS